MEHATLFCCHNCENKKPWDEFKLREKDDKYGRKGEPTGRCLPCAEKERHRRQNAKRKRDEEGLNPSGVPEEPEPILPVEQFTVLLRELALGGDPSCRTRVSTQGLVGEDGEVFKVIIGRVWEATGFRFTYGWFSLEVQSLMFPIIQLDSGINTSRRMVLSNECTNAAKLKPAATIVRRSRLNKASKSETPAECLASLAKGYSM